MLKITVPEQEWYDEDLEKFFTTPARTVTMEHSLVSISKWEAIWRKPFLNNTKMTAEEAKSYAECMTITQNVPSEFYDRLGREQYFEINEYIAQQRTATTVKHLKKDLPGGRGQTITSEVIYGWMIAFNIPSEYQKWHLSRLMMLIEVCNAQQNPQKMSKKDAAAHYKALNAERLKKTGGKG